MTKKVLRTLGLGFISSLVASIVWDSIIKKLIKALSRTRTLRLQAGGR